MEELTPKDLFLQSVGRCVANELFLPEFYSRFVGASEEIQARFRFTDFDQQYLMLRRSLELCAGATSGDPESMREINERALTHDRDHLNIKPEFYDVWLETIIDTARIHDSQWDEAVETAWQRILGHVVKHMLRKY